MFFLIPPVAITPNPDFLVSDSQWQALFAAPNSTLQESKAAWEPVAKLLAREMFKLPSGFNHKDLTELARRLGPAGTSMLPAIGVECSAIPVRNADHSALFTITATIRDSKSSGMLSRNSAILVTVDHGHVVPQILTGSLRLHGGQLYEGSAYREGSWLAIGGCDWNVSLSAGYGPPTAALFHWTRGRWRLVASRVENMSGVATVDPGPRIPKFRVTLMDVGDSVLATSYQSPAFEYFESWKLKGNALVYGHRHAVRNGYWAAGGLVKALRAHDFLAARAFVTSDDVLKQAQKTEIDRDYGRWGAYDIGWGQEAGLELSGQRPNKTDCFIFLHFKTENQITLVSAVTTP